MYKVEWKAPPIIVHSLWKAHYTPSNPEENIFKCEIFPNHTDIPITITFASLHLNKASSTSDVFASSILVIYLSGLF